MIFHNWAIGSLWWVFLKINFIVSFITIFFSCKPIIVHYTTLKQRKIRFIRKKKSQPLYTFGSTSFFRTSFNVSSIFTGLIRICSFGNLILIISNLYHDWRKQILFEIKSPIFPLFFSVEKRKIAFQTLISDPLRLAFRPRLFKRWIALSTG